MWSVTKEMHPQSLAAAAWGLSVRELKDLDAENTRHGLHSLVRCQCRTAAVSMRFCNYFAQKMHRSCKAVTGPQLGPAQPRVAAAPAKHQPNWADIRGKLLERMDTIGSSFSTAPPSPDNSTSTATSRGGNSCERAEKNIAWCQGSAGIRSAQLHQLHKRWRCESPGFDERSKRQRQIPHYLF